MASTYASALIAARHSYSPSPHQFKNQKQQQLQKFALRTGRSAMVVKAEGGINPSIRKEEPKVVDNVQVSELSKPLTPYCRCWRSGTFPLCDGSHVKHNKETGDNVGPLLIKK